MNLEDFRKDLDAFIEPIIERRDELKKEIEVAKKYNSSSYMVDQAELELNILSKIVESFMQVLARLDAYAIKEKKKSFQIPTISISKYRSPKYIRPPYPISFFQPLRYPPKQSKDLKPKGELGCKI